MVHTRIRWGVPLPIANGDGLQVFITIGNLSPTLRGHMAGGRIITLLKHPQAKPGVRPISISNCSNGLRSKASLHAARRPSPACSKTHIPGLHRLSLLRRKPQSLGNTDMFHLIACVLRCTSESIRMTTPYQAVVAQS